MSKLFVMALASATIFLLTACASSRSSRELTGGIWLLTELKGAAPITGTSITAEFDQDGRVGGSSGCNSYSTTYTMDGSKLTFGEQVATTLMACPEPIMEQEREYQHALSNTDTYEIKDGELILKDSDGNEVARFEVIDQALEGSSWQVMSYNNGKGGVTSLIIGTEISANFGEDGQLAGNSGCNSYFAEYETDGDNINIGKAGSTEMACLEPEGVMEQEQLYLAALETADTYKIEAMTMEMRTNEGSLVVTFQRALNP
jgi:heat shock protein HslJ